MKCPSCNKFAGLDTSNDPEVDLDIDRVENCDAGEGEDETAGLDTTSAVRVYITGTVRIFLTSECCSEEMKEATFDVEEDFELDRAEGCTCNLGNLELSTSEEVTDRSESEIVKVAKRGPNKGKEVRRAIPPRYQKRFYGAEVSIEVSCSCGKSSVTTIWKDEAPASGMDEL